jgi:large subunit ribosomal protein L9
MRIILLQRVDKLGHMGQIIDVKDGYARHFLLPQKKAIRATEDNIAQFETQKQHLEAENIKSRAEAEHLGGKIDGTVVTIIRQASETGILYGSIRNKDITDALETKSITINRQQISLDQPIKTLGSHKVRVVLHPEVTIFISVRVAQSLEEAAAQDQAAAAKKAKKEASAHIEAEATLVTEEEANA